MGTPEICCFVIKWKNWSWIVLWCQCDSRAQLVCDPMGTSQLSCLVMPLGYQSSAVLWCHGDTRVQLFCNAMGTPEFSYFVMLWGDRNTSTPLFCDAMGTPELRYFVMLWGNRDTRSAMFWMPWGYHSWPITIPMKWTIASLTSINPDGRTARTVWGYLQQTQWTSFYWSSNSLKIHKLMVSICKVVQVAMNVCQRVIWLPSHAVTWTQTCTAYE